MKRLVALAILVASMPVAAQDTSDLIWGTGETGELLTWRILEDNLEGVTVTSTGTFSWLKFHPYENAVPQGLLLIDITATYTFIQDGDGTWAFTFETDQGLDWSECFWHVTTVNPGGFLAGDLVAYATYNVRCATAAVLVEDATVTYWINRTVLSGAPASLEDQHISVTGDRGDFVIMSQPTSFELLTGLTASEFLIIVPGLPLLGIYLWTRKDLGIQLFGIVLVGVDLSLLISHYVISRAWSPQTGIAVLVLLLFCYMLTRTVRDQMKKHGSPV